MGAGSVFNIKNQKAGRDIIQGETIYFESKDVNISQNISVEDMLKIVDEIQCEVSELNIEEKNKDKIKNNLNNAIIELKDKNPSKDSIADSIRQTNNILKEAKSAGDSIKDIGILVSKAAIWLGTTAVKLGWAFK